MNHESLTRLIRQARFACALWRADAAGKAAVYRRFLDITFGKNCRITGRIKFGSEPYLISIGDNVTLADNIVFHTHDGGVHVLRNQHPGLNVFGRIRIGNNVFVGSDVIILPGVTIGDNVVIGAGSVVTRDVPPDVVVAGVPARIIKSLEAYREDCLAAGIKVDVTDPAARKAIITSVLLSREP